MDNLTIIISADAMTACLTGSIAEPLDEHQAAARIQRLIKSHRITFGTRHVRVAEAVLSLVNNGTAGPIVIALGEHPYRAIPYPQFTVPVYDEKLIPPATGPEDMHEVHYSDLLSRIATPFIVHREESIGEIRCGTPESTGMTVLGKSCESDMHLPDALGDGIARREDPDRIVATRVGIVIRGPFKTYLLPVNVDGRAVVEVSKDRLTAHLKLLPCGPGGRHITRGDIDRVLREAALQCTLPHEEIDRTLASWMRVPGKTRSLLIARGTPAVDGDDARIEYQVNLSFSREPSVRLDGSSDYFSIHVFENVIAGQPLARLVAATPGTAGKDVYGNCIDPQPGRNVQLHIGRNIGLLKDDTKTVVSDTTGHVYLRGETLLVEENLTIPGDVDFNTGNINYPGDVTVKGDVKGGFSIKAGGNVTVEGSVEDAFIEAGENIIIQGAFLGRGNGRIKAGRDVVVRHVRNQTIVAKGNIMIGGECIDASLYAGNMALVESLRSCIMGGTIIARSAVRAYQIGSEGASTTRIAVGIDHFIKHALLEMDRDVDEIRKTMATLESRQESIDSQPRTPALAQEHSRNIQELARLRTSAQEKLDNVAKYRKNYKKMQHITKGQIWVLSVIYPGASIEIGPLRHLVHGELRRSLYYANGNEIVGRPLSEISTLNLPRE